MKDNYTNLVKKQMITPWFSLLFWSGNIRLFGKHRPVFRFNLLYRISVQKDFHFNRG